MVHVNDESVDSINVQHDLLLFYKENGTVASKVLYVLCVCKHMQQHMQKA